MPLKELPLKLAEPFQPGWGQEEPRPWNTPAVPDVSVDTEVLDVVFHITRSKWRLDTASLPGFLIVDGNLQATAPRNVIRLRFDPAGFVANATITVSYTGQPPDFIKFVFRNAALEGLGGFKLDFGNPAGDLQPLDSLDGPSMSSPDAAEFWDALGNDLGSVPETDPSFPFLKYFYKLDIHTHPQLWSDWGDAETKLRLDWPLLNSIGITDYNRIGAAIQAVMAVLRWRTTVRVQYWQYYYVAKFSPLGSNYISLRGDIASLSNLMLAIETSVRDDLFPIFLDLEEAFVRFSSGMLRRPQQAGQVDFQPQSAFYFFFAEFALLAIENGFAVPEWTQSIHLDSWLKTQPLYTENYRGVTPALPQPGPNQLVTVGINKVFDDYEASKKTAVQAPAPWMMARYDGLVGMQWRRQQASENAFAYLAGLGSVAI